MRTIAPSPNGRFQKPGTRQAPEMRKHLKKVFGAAFYKKRQCGAGRYEVRKNNNFAEI